jgi:diadenylate cyclase
MGVITVYVGDVKHTLEEIPRLLVRGNQALQTLERYKVRLDDAATSLTELEVEDVVTVRDVASMLQRSETVRRVAEQIQTSIVELGMEAHLIRLQLDELLEDVDDDRELVLLDYLPDDKDERLAGALAALAALSTDDLRDLRCVAAIVVPGAEDQLDLSLQPRGYRLLDKVPRLAEDVVDDLVSRFGTLQKLMRATTEDLASIDDVDVTLAHTIREGLARQAESALLDRFH